MNIAFRDNLKIELKQLSKEELREYYKSKKAELYKLLVIGNTIESEIHSMTPNKYVVTKINYSKKNKAVIKSITGRDGSYETVIPVEDIIMENSSRGIIDFDDYKFPISLEFIKFLNVK